MRKPNKVMETPKTTEKVIPLIVYGRNAAGKIIEGSVPAGELSVEDPGLAIQEILARHSNIQPTSV